MGLFSLFKKKPLTHDEKLQQAYSCYKPELVGLLFPDGKQQADRILQSLAHILEMDLESCGAKEYYETLSVYTDVVIRKIVVHMEDEKIIENLRVKHGFYVSSNDQAQLIVNYTLLNMSNPNYTIKNDTDIRLLKELSGESSSLPDEDMNHISDEPVERSSEISFGFYFEDVAEMRSYIKHFGNTSVQWIRGDDYLNQYLKGYQLIEEGRYQEAIQQFRACLSLNPIGLSARFEICEAYLHMQNLEAARRTLLEMSEYLSTPLKIARFYRRLGYLEAEENHYICAAACYIYSSKFERHASVNQELLYIRSKEDFDIEAIFRDPVLFLTQYHIPVIYSDSE